MQNEKYDLLIIGSGPAGLNPPLYPSRANLKVGFVEKGAPGGKLSTTSKVENWVGRKMIDGAGLALELFDHAQAYGAQYIYGEVASIKSHSLFDKEVLLKDGKVLK
ncbi:thioredoxin reductase, partial [Mycoplasmopsis synoviae]